MKPRRFVASPAERAALRLILALYGPSASGKTYSALRLATGICRVIGGKPYFVDTESERAKHYADEFNFMHVPFDAPFTSLDYAAAVDFCARHDDCSVVIVDSTSHEWDGMGGVLEYADEQEQTLAKRWKKKPHEVGIAKWTKPKLDHRRFVNTLLQVPAHVILCFRAKETTKPKPGDKPLDMGIQPITGSGLLHEAAASMLLRPGSNGVPDWDPKNKEERKLVKRPHWSGDILKPGRQLTEDVGVELANWCAGDDLRTIEEIAASFGDAASQAEYGKLRLELRRVWQSATADQRDAVTAAMNAAKERLTTKEDDGGEADNES